MNESIYTIILKSLNLSVDMNFTENNVLDSTSPRQNICFSALYKTEFGTVLLNFNFTNSLLGVLGSTIGF